MTLLKPKRFVVCTTTHVRSDNTVIKRGERFREDADAVKDRRELFAPDGRPLPTVIHYRTAA